MIKPHFFSCFALCLTLAGPTLADSPTRETAKFASGAGNLAFLAAGVGLPLLRDGGAGKNRTLRTIDAVGTTILLTEGIKALTREKRPDSDEHNSFPSGHASAAFAVATLESQFHPREAPLWFLGATLIAASRVRLNRHHPQDVFAGAALGYGVGRLEISAPRGLILSPLITPGGVGMQISGGF